MADRPGLVSVTRTVMTSVSDRPVPVAVRSAVVTVTRAKPMYPAFGTNVRPASWALTVAGDPVRTRVATGFALAVSPRPPFVAARVTRTAAVSTSATRTALVPVNGSGLP